MSMNVSSHQVQQSREERVSRNLGAARSPADLHPAPQMAQVVHSHKQELKQSAGQRASTLKHWKVTRVAPREENSRLRAAGRKLTPYSLHLGMVQISYTAF